MWFKRKTDNPKKEIKSWHIILLISIAVLSVIVWIRRGSMQSVVLEVRGEYLTVLVAESFIQQYRGLGSRESLGEYDGMLFPFGYEGKHTIVMRDMQFPIDIIWLKYNEIVDIAPQVPLEPGVPEAQLFRYVPRKEATFVLELPAGKAESLGLQIGDIVRLVEED